MKAGQDAVMQRWLMSAQKFRRNPSGMFPPPPIRTTCTFAPPPLWSFDILLLSLLSCLGPVSLDLVSRHSPRLWPKAIDRWEPHVIMTRFQRFIWPLEQGVSSYDKLARADPASHCDPGVASDADDRRHARGQGKAPALA